MIYVFGKDGQEVSIVYDGSILTQEQKLQSIQIEALPEKPAEKENNRLALINRGGNAVWEYIDTTDIVANQIQEAIDAYTMDLIEGGLL